MRFILATIVLLIPTIVFGSDKASIISLNPARQQPQPSPPPSVGDSLKVTAGKLQILKLDKYNGPAVTWNVIQPLDTKDTEIQLVEWVVMPKAAPIFGFLEGETKARKHQFDTETVVVLATGNGSGKVRVRALVCGGGVVKVVAEIVLQVGEGGPTPQPPPDPQPPTPPQPVQPQKLFVVIIEESADAVIGRGVMLADVALAARMKEKGHKWRIADKDVVGPDGKPPADIKRFLDSSKGKPLPQVFLVNEKGETQVQQDLPKTPAELLELLKKCGG